MAWALLAAAGLFGLAVAADLAAVAAWYGPEYLRRIVIWRRPNPNDGARFPARPIAAAADPARFPRDFAGEAQVRAAFRGDGTLERFLAGTGSTSFLVLHRGRLFYEGYFGGATRSSPQPSFSIAKSVTALLVGAAIADGLMPPVDTLAERLLPQVPGLRASGVTVRNLLQMSSGFATHNGFPLGPFSRPWRDDQVFYFAPDLRRSVAGAVRPGVPPGTRFHYEDRNPMLLGMMLERATHGTVAAFLQRRLWQPMGAEFAAEWSLDRRDGFEKMESGIQAAPIDFLKLGDLVLRDGATADGRRLLPAAWIDAMTAPGVADYGYLWWRLARLDGPADVYAEGIFGQVLFVSRHSDTVILRTGTGGGGVDWPRTIRAIADALP